MKLFGTSGIRRIADRELLKLALKVGLVVGERYWKVVVGCDTRTSGDAVKCAFTSGVLGAGAECHDAGVVPTPTLALAAREFQAGAMITASHNPPEYNGIKLLNPDGSAFNTDQQKQIEEAISSDVFSSASWNDIKSMTIYEGAIDKHIEHILEAFPGRYKVRVVVDCACAAASLVTPRLLKEMGCEVVEMNCLPSGFFPRPAEPTEADLGELMEAVKEVGADLGIAHDGDADRMMAVDDRGQFIFGEALLAIYAREIGAEEVVTTLDASMAVDELDFHVIRTPVGDNYVSEELKKGGDFGGEPSGSWVFPGSSLCPDGIYAVAQLVDIASRQKLSGLIDAVPRYKLIRNGVTMKGELNNLKEELMALGPVSLNDVDGIRLGFEDGWVLVRPSGTEPKIRITVEAKNPERANQLHRDTVDIINEAMRSEE
jgi:phosphoglucosamine mutase